MNTFSFSFEDEFIDDIDCLHIPENQNYIDSIDLNDNIFNDEIFHLWI